jgi:hypothetical protein
MFFKVTIVGVSPLLCNKFTDAAALAVSGNTSAVMRGQKPPPREQAQAKLYLDSNGKPTLPGTNLMRSIVNAGSFVKSGKSKLSTQRSSVIPAGMSISEIELPIAGAKWETDSRSVVIPSTGGRIMCHRPRFDDWRVNFTLDVDETMFSEAIARELLDLAGKRIGVGDFRPERKGPFGRFRVDQWKRILHGEVSRG